VPEYGLTYTAIITAAGGISGEAYANSQWLLWIGDWLDDMCEASKVLKTGSINLVVGQTDYPIPDDCRLIRAMFRVRSNTKYPLDKLRPADLESEGWLEVDGKIRLQEVTIRAGDTLYLVYNKRFAHPVEADLNTKPTDIPAEFHSSGTDYLANRASAKELWQDERNYYYAEYLRKRGNYASAEDRRIGRGKIEARRWE
jgi:hypothetical protein